MVNLDRLEAFWCDAIHDQGMLRTLSNKCKRISYIGFRCEISSHHWSFVTNAASSRSLSVDVEAELRAFDGLKILDLSSYSRGFGMPLANSSTLLNNIPVSVKAIHLTDEPIRLANASQLQKCTKHLETVRLTRFTSWMHDKIRTLITFDHMNLRELKLSRSWFVNLVGMTTWLQDACRNAAFPRLTFLEVACASEYAIGPEYLQDHEWLGFDKALVQFVRTHTQLVALIVSGCPQGYEIGKALDDLPSLRALSVTLSHIINLSTLQQLRLSQKLSWLELNLPGDMVDKTLWVSL